MNSGKWASFMLFVCMAWPMTTSAQSGQVEVVEIPTRAGVMIRAIYGRADSPAASAVLFAGGRGRVGIYRNGTVQFESYLTGSTSRFIRNGISVLVVEVPSDRTSLNGFRHTPEHAADNAALIAYLRQRARVPVWMIGVSNGAASAAAAGLLIKENGPDGIVLSSSPTLASFGDLTSVVTDLPLQDLTVPVLVVHHKNDPCFTTPYAGMTELMASLSRARKRELITLEGGNKGNNPCSAGYHLFSGIEDTAIQLIADWIKQRPPSGTLAR